MIKIDTIISRFYLLSKWFNRESQHYMLGNWLKFVGNKKKWDYRIHYPRAYIKFMWLCRDDLIKGIKNNL